MWLRDRIIRWTRPEKPAVAVTVAGGAPKRGRVDHVVILDGTLSSLDPGYETNAGLVYKLLSEVTPKRRVSVYYEAGIQWEGWRRSNDVIQGHGINRQIRRAYGFLASRYQPGDRIYLMGYSRGAYAVRSLAGIIDQVGLLRADAATMRNVTTAYRHYQLTPDSDTARAFAAIHCHPHVEVEMVGVWDTVKALGIRFPLLWMLSEAKHSFHNHRLGSSIRFGFHALAMHENRAAFAPVLWDCPEGREARVEQVWFRGAHGDIGGQLGTFMAARPLANIPLVWMLERAEGCGMPLPDGWRARFPCDPDAPAVGAWRSWAKFFLLRRRRPIGLSLSEAVHPTARPFLRGPTPVVVQPGPAGRQV